MLKLCNNPECDKQARTLYCCDVCRNRARHLRRYMNANVSRMVECRNNRIIAKVLAWPIANEP